MTLGFVIIDIGWMTDFSGWTAVDDSPKAEFPCSLGRETDCMTRGVSWTTTGWTVT